MQGFTQKIVQMMKNERLFASQGGLIILSQKNHPSALSSFEEIKSVAHEKQMVVFLDYDGTLSPIVNNPDQAFMSTEMRSAVREIGEHFPTAIISGRSRNKVNNSHTTNEIIS
ncbi:hypothetical protein ACB094_10G172300 [Castanea mollissima]